MFFSVNEVIKAHIEKLQGEAIKKNGKALSVRALARHIGISEGTTTLIIEGKKLSDKKQKEVLDRLKIEPGQKIIGSHLNFSLGDERLNEIITSISIIIKSLNIDIKKRLPFVPSNNEGDLPYIRVLKLLIQLHSLLDLHDAKEYVVLNDLHIPHQMMPDILTLFDIHFLTNHAIENGYWGDRSSFGQNIRELWEEYALSRFVKNKAFEEKMVDDFFCGAKVFEEYTTKKVFEMDDWMHNAYHFPFEMTEDKARYFIDLYQIDNAEDFIDKIIASVNRQFVDELKSEGLSRNDFSFPPASYNHLNNNEIAHKKVYKEIASTIYGKRVGANYPIDNEVFLNDLLDGCEYMHIGFYSRTLAKKIYQISGGDYDSFRDFVANSKVHASAFFNTIYPYVHNHRYHKIRRTLDDSGLYAARDFPACLSFGIVHRYAAWHKIETSELKNHEEAVVSWVLDLFDLYQSDLKKSLDEYVDMMHLDKLMETIKKRQEEGVTVSDKLNKLLKRYYFNDN